jgi:hypothetical protein
VVTQATGCSINIAASGLVTVTQGGGCAAGDYVTSIKASAAGNVDFPASLNLHITAATAGSPVPFTYGPGVDQNNSPIMEAIRDEVISDIRGRVVVAVGPGGDGLDVWDMPAGAQCGSSVAGGVKVNTTRFNADAVPYTSQSLFQGSYNLAQNHYLCLVRTGTAAAWLGGTEQGELQVSVQ